MGEAGEGPRRKATSARGSPALVPAGEGETTCAKGGAILWEAKQTSGVSISVKAVHWSNLRKNAMMEGMMPALALRIGDVNLVVISQDDFDERFPPDEP